MSQTGMVRARHDDCNCTEHHWYPSLGQCTEPKYTERPQTTVLSPCCHLAKDTAVSATVPPEYRAVFLFFL